MKENPNMNAYSGEERIDELLNGYIDDELGARQHTEVERLIANDVEIKQRLRQLKKCRELLGSLPCTKAPPEVLRGLQASMASTARLHDQSSYNQRAGRIHLLVRKVLSAAAMLALAALLGAVIYTILAPEPPTEDPPVVAASDTAVAPTLAFSGKLQLKTEYPAEVGAIIGATIEENGLSDTVAGIREPNKRIHYLRCSREDLKSVLASLDSVWPRLESAKLVLDTEVFGREVTVRSVTTEQIAEIIDQNSNEKRVELARDFHLLNTADENIPGKTILAAIEGEPADGISIPKPIITGPGKNDRPEKVEEDKTIRLTIILSR
jgi:hypothetical protein